MLRDRTVMFIGHRDYCGPKESDLKKMILHLVEEKGAAVFLSGGMGAFDRMCARCVFEIKEEVKGLQNNLVLPYPDYPVWEKMFFDHLVFPAELEGVPPRAAIVKRNLYMVKNAAFAICCVDVRRPPMTSGASATFQAAVREGLCIYNLFDL